MYSVQAIYPKSVLLDLGALSAKQAPPQEAIDATKTRKKAFHQR